jgi:hypothetical protein
LARVVPPNKGPERRGIVLEAKWQMLGGLGCQKIECCAAILHQRNHPFAVQPKQTDRQLAQIVPVRPDREAPGAAQCVGGLLFQRR